MAAEPDDAALLRAHVAGDADAFSALVRRHRDRLWAVAMHTTGDPEEAADAVQDALISAYRRAGSFRGDAQVTTWLHRIVVNACLDRMRRQKSHPTDPLPEAADRLGALADARQHRDPAEVSERRADVLAALGQIPSDQRVALVLVDMEGYSVGEAAQLMQCAAGTVKSRCARGRARLAPLLTQYQATQDPGNQTGSADVQPRSAPPARDGSGAVGTADEDPGPAT
ncbi:MAG: RNA polymerase sigma factor SigM [Nocardioidaceae bacterium]